jgi:Ankyrin repeats (many copies)
MIPNLLYIITAPLSILRPQREVRLKFLKKLIAADVDVNYCDPSTGENVFHVAAQYGQLEIAELPNYDGGRMSTPSVLSMEMPLYTKQ